MNRDNDSRGGKNGYNDVIEKYGAQTFEDKNSLKKNCFRFR